MTSLNACSADGDFDSAGGPSGYDGEFTVDYTAQYKSGDPNYLTSKGNLTLGQANYNNPYYTTFTINSCMG
eukprot:CAMPEP_0181288188 /NCGR_PEP_ID=MMETSP1101-20121128/196_1 /TAXON_ID=46948 /ORGANISM="Rhodomonas abbreviata, Strain Caron Lab Isolate" /LENGTH=70 /DNA_ID=CAMNT_0023392287 /DNA_START=271 /DNA_END=483 /DNA_ORIENTATION=+